jgi:chitodextrinase
MTVFAANTRHLLPVLVAALACLLLVADGASGGARAKLDRPGRDTEAPTAPTNLRVTAATTSSISIAWDPSTDNVRVRGYSVYVNGDRSNTSSTSFVIWNVTCGESVAVEVSAYDKAGNRSTRTGATVSAAPCPDRTPPTAPDGFRQMATSEKAVVLAWDPSADDTGVVGYGVYRGGLPLTASQVANVTLSELACSSTYEYAVDAVDAAGNRSARSPVWVTTSSCPTPPPADTQPPTTPVTSLGTKTADSLVLQWQPSTDNVGVLRYDLFLGTSGVSTSSQQKVGETSGLSFTFGGLDCGTDYSLAVQAVDAAGNKSVLGDAFRFPVRTADCPPQLPPPDTTPPSTPANLAVGSATASSIALTWTASTDNVGVIGYGVYRNGTSLPAVNQPGATVSGLQCGTAYTLEVDAFDAATNRSPRASITASTAACPDTQAPTAPTNVVASSRTTTSIALTWAPSNDAVGVTGYGLYRAGQPAGTATSTTGIFSGLECNTAYTLSVDAYDAAGNHSAKTTVMVSTTACPPPPPPTVTMGESSVMSTNDTGNGNLLVSQKATLAQNGILRRMSFYVTTASGNLRMAVYAANGANGGPGTKLAETSSFTPTTGWNSVDVLAPVTLGAGNYWLAYMPSSSTLAFRAGSGSEARWTNYSYGPAPATFPATTLGDTVHWSLYATLDVTNQAPAPLPPPPTPAAQCADSTDNDADGAVDMTDPGCTGTTDNDETNPAPAPAPAPTPPPTSGGYPDASTTGPTGALTESTGNITISTPGAVLENRKINGCVTVNAANVTIRNSEIRCDGASVVWSGSTGLVVENTVIECGHRPGTTGLTPGNYTVRRSELFGCENILWAQSNVVIEDSYIHDPIPCCTWPAPTPHTDSIQVPAGGNNIRIEHNRVYGGYINQSDFGNAAITASASPGTSASNMIVNNNLLAGGGYTLYCPGADGGFTWTNNRFSRIYRSTVGGFGPVYHTCAQHTNSGNVYDDTGAPITG